MSATIITDAVRGEIADFCRAFATRYMMQPPEFTDPRYLDGFADLYERSVGGRTNPTETGWYARLITSATAADLDALTAAFDTTDSYATCMQRFVLRQLLRAAYERDQAGMEVAPALPAWYRAAGWGMPADWNCERAPPPPPALERRHEECAMHDGLYDAEGRHALGRSTTSGCFPTAEEAGGGIPPTCTCAGGAAGTPPGSPLPAAPLWRTGSCGESGPFIGLSFPYSIALVKRMDADVDGRANAFALRDAVCAEPEPNVLRDFTLKEIVDGMAGSYSWPAARTLAWLKETVLATPDPVEAVGELSPAVGTPPASPSASPAPYMPIWRQGSCGESGPFIGLSYPYSIALVKRMNADPDGHRNAFSLKQEICAGPKPDVFRDFTVQEVIGGMGGSYSWDRERTLDWLIYIGARGGTAWCQLPWGPPAEE